MSGLLSHQNRLNVIGDNIANANTTAFKRSRVAFGEILGQQLVGVSRTQGGSSINPAFVGNGVSVGSIDKNWNQGSLEFTNLRTDIALNGDGFFIANKGGRNILTRAGNFSFNDKGELVTASGLNVQGYGVDSEGNIDPSRLQTLKLDPNTKDPPKFTENATIAGNLSSDAAVGDTYEISTSVYDEQGTAHNVTISFEKTAAAPSDPNDAWEYTIEYGGDPADSPFGGNATGTLTVAADGSVSGDTTPQLTWNTDAVGSGANLTFNLEELTQYSGSSTAVVQDQDGNNSGEVVGYNIDTKGKLVLNFSNGEQQVRGQIAVGNVNNPQGLEQLGDNFFGVTAQSGDLKIGRAGQEISTSMVSGALEQSNVDIATEFTDMITTQRGYQASARVLTTSDEILQETLQLKR
jgi:flagellar hook protein FlgE